VLVFRNPFRIIFSPLPQPDSSSVPADNKPIGEDKAYQSTLLDFESDFEDLVDTALKGDMPRSRFAIVSRALLRKYGRLSMLDGLKDGGIETSELDSDDQAVYVQWLAEQSSYLTDFANRIYKPDLQNTRFCECLQFTFVEFFSCDINHGVSFTRPHIGSTWVKLF